MRKTFSHVASMAFMGMLIMIPQVAFGLVDKQGNEITLGKFDITTVNGQATAVGVSTSTTSAILTNIVNYALAIIGFLGVLGFIISGIMYLVSAGDEKLAEKAKGYMVNSIIGITVALLGYVVMAAISTLLGAGNIDNGL